jgi:hypothetical protein
MIASGSGGDGAEQLSVRGHANFRRLLVAVAQRLEPTVAQRPKLPRFTQPG